MESHELLCTFRDDALDNVEPFHWTNTEIYQYINDAYFMFVRLTDGIADGSSPATLLVAKAGQATTLIDKSIMRIRTATNVTDGNRPVKVLNVQDTDEMTDDDYGFLRTLGNNNVPGPVRYLISGEDETYVRWRNIPVVDTQIQLVVERLPLVPITRDRQQLKGVRIEHHYHLLKWVRHLAYRKQDADLFDLVKSDQERDDFIAYCNLAKNEKAVRKHKVRVVAYGGL
jgi:hypothetical protein